MLPKVELHLHLDCSLSYDVVRALRPTISRAQYENDFIAPSRCTNLADFLKRAPSGFALMQTENELRAVVLDLFRQLQADNVIYAEIRFAPLLHCEKGLSPERVVRAVDEAVSEGTACTGVEARVILCTLRHFSEAQSLATVELLEKFWGSSNVVALDIAGDEAGFPIDAHLAAFEHAIARGFHRTAHAGEARGAESVWETLRCLRPTRIGHGIRSSEDPALVEHLRATGVHLEVCPTCNVQTNIFAEMRDHSVDRLYRAGVSLGISTDARTIVNTTLEQEYDELRRAFGWSEADFRQCNRNALEAAFLPEEVKARLRRLL